jgi:hypothetical protein
MKTRIVVKQYNSGRETFTCQRNDINFLATLWMLLSVIGTAPAIVIIICGDWRDMEKKWPKDPFVVLGKERNIYIPAEFNNIEEAKAFLDDYHKKHIEKEREKFKNKLKKTVKIKYP